MKLSQFRPGKKTLIALLIVAAFGGTGWYFIAKPSDNKGGFGGFGGRFGGTSKAQPVSASAVQVQDVPIWINAIGTMVPRNLVTVQSRVAGELMKVNFVEGQTVKAGQLLAEIDPRPLQASLTQANGQLARDIALLKNAQVDLERYRTLLAQDSISKQQVATQESLVRQYQGTVEVDRGVVANAELQLAYTHITAPVSGRVGLRQVDPGNQIVSTGTNIVIIAQVQPITAVFSVPEVNLPAVVKALNAKEATAVEVWDRELKNRLAVGKLLTADNQIDTSTGTLKLKAEFKNDDNTLFPNQFVNVKLAAGIAEQAKTVPGSAVLRGAKGSFVYVIKDDKVSALPVTTGPTSGDQIVIEGNIEAGTQVVTDGADKLRDGAQVEVISDEARKKAVSSDGVRHGKRRQGGAPGGGADTKSDTTADKPANNGTEGAWKRQHGAAEGAAPGVSSTDSGRPNDGNADQTGKAEWKHRRESADGAPSGISGGPADATPRSPEEWKKRREAREAAQKSNAQTNGQQAGSN